MAYFPPTGSVVAFQSDPTKLVGTVSVIGALTFADGTALNHSGGNAMVNVGNFATDDFALDGGVSSTLTSAWMFSPGYIWDENGGVWRKQPGSASIGTLVHMGASSVVTRQSGTVISSALSFVIRNDTLASTLGADGTYRTAAGDSAGRIIVKPFAADEGTFRFTTSVVSTSVTLIQASAIGKRSYITDFWIANTNTVNSVAALITFQDGSTSIVSRTIAPAGGGSNAPGIAIPPRTNPSQDLAFTVSPAPSILYITVNGYQAP